MLLESKLYLNKFENSDSNKHKKQKGKETTFRDDGIEEKDFCPGGTQG